MNSVLHNVVAGRMAKSGAAAKYPWIVLLTATILITWALSSTALCEEFGVTGDVASQSQMMGVQGENGIDDVFRTINRRKLKNCVDINPYLKFTVDTEGPLADVQTVTVQVSGVLVPSKEDWIAVVSPVNSSIEDCASSEVQYLLTGDTSDLPLLCHYPVKFQRVTNDPGYLSCDNSNCTVPGVLGSCVVKTCSGSVTFRLINIRTDIEFVLFTNGLQVPCILRQTDPVSFANPSSPLYGHLSSIDSTGNSMRLTWVSGDALPQTVQFAGNRSVVSTTSTFTPNDLCDKGAASDFGWHEPGYIHTAVMSQLSPSTEFSYRYGSATAGYSALQTFTTPPAAGDDNVTIIIYGDMGKAERDNSTIHYIQPGALGVVDAVTKAVDAGGVDFIFHIGDISYATGFLVEWENFLDNINPIASRVSYMTAVGNHERDNPDSGSYYGGTDSGGECGIPYYTHFQMPTIAQDKPWYSIESGPVHFTIVSTEHDWRSGSEQYNWIQTDLASVNRVRTPWVIYAGHRPMYSSLVESLFNEISPSVDKNYTATMEPILLKYKVDLVFAGHVHNYERLCSVYEGNCLQSATKDASGVDTFDFTTYTAPVQAVIGMSGFTLDAFSANVSSWSTVRISAFGYCSFEATHQKLLFKYIYTNGTVGDTFAIVKN